MLCRIMLRQILCRPPRVWLHRGAAGGSTGAPEEARGWIKDWRARSLERALPQDEPVGSARR